MFHNQSGRSFLRKKVQIRRNFATTCTQKSTQGGRSERPQNRIDAKPCLSDVYKERTRAKRRQADVRLSGRSMVEMLGVLAIIGVLSVGAISGYSKAMFKYKLNKQAEAVNSLINYGLQYKDRLEHDNGKVTYYNDIFYKLRLIPDGIKYIHNTQMSDIFDNSLFVYYNNQKWENDAGQAFQNDFGGIIYNFAPSPQGAEICRNLVKVARENSPNLWMVETYKYYSDSENVTIHGNLYGDAYCGTGRYKCLRDLGLTELKDLCNICDEEACRLVILWK